MPYQSHPPVVRSRFETWRDYAALAVIISGVSYGIYKLYEVSIKVRTYYTAVPLRYRTAPSCKEIVMLLNCGVAFLVEL